MPGREQAKGVRLPISFKHLLVRLTLRIFRGLTFFKNGLGLFFTFGFLKPISWFGRGLFKVFLLPGYTVYLRVKQRIKTHPRLAGIRSVGHFLERYAIYAALVLLGVMTVGNNLFARTIRPDEIGRGAIWTSFVSSETSELITETSAAQPLTSNRLTAYAVGGLTARTTPAPSTQTTDTLPNDGPPLTAIGGVPIAPADDATTARQETITYTVQTGDTLSTIAHRYGLTSQTLVWANGMSDRDFIKPGQDLKIPPVEGFLYTIKKGDTLASIAQKYKGEQTSILDTNHLATAEAIQPGQEIIIPGGEPPAPIVPAPSQRGYAGRVYSGPDNRASAPPSAAATGARFIWPTSGHHINQYFRGRYHTGIDIEGTYASPIYAAAAGRVVFAAYDRSGYGLHIVIDHGNGYDTLYGHASKVFVSVGDRVRQGETIAMIGSTGRSTGSHLHFEIRTGGGFLNPFAFY